jgi:dethiobiotin synthetase
MRNTAVTSISVSDFRIITKIDKYSVGIFEAAWKRGSSFTSIRQSILQSLISVDFNLAFLHHITVRGGDNAENYVVDKLFVKNLPAVVIFSSGGILEHVSEIHNDGTFDVATFIAEFSRVASSNNSIRPNITVNEDQDKHIDPSRQICLPSLVSLIFDNDQYRKASVTDSTTTTPKLTDQVDQDSPKTLTVFLSGDRSSVGKSSICLALLGSLIRLGVNPNCMAYIKPVTQCEAAQPVTEYCSKVGISHRGVGPVVFFKGFTRAYLSGETDSAENLTQAAVDAVNEISVGKRIVIIDGVGYPSVGSICNLSNADIARAIGCPVLLIGKSGVGDAVDSYNLNARFFESYGVTVLGGIFNKLSLEGFYELEACKKAVSAYFLQHRPGHQAYGFMPILSTGETDKGNIEVDPIPKLPLASNLVLAQETSPSISMPMPTPVPLVTSPSDDDLVNAFIQYVDIGQLLLDIFKYSVRMLND